MAATLPVFAHVPLLVNEKRQKLSKRRDPVALELYRDEGYLPEAMQNFLMLLGWAPPDDREIMPFKELAELWRLEDVHSSPAYFDVKKLEAFNGEYIRAMSTEEFVDRCQPWLVAPHAPWHPEHFDRAVFESMAPLVQTRVTRLVEVPALVDFLFLEEPQTDPASWDKAMKASDAATVLDDTITAYETAPWDADSLKAALEMVGSVSASSSGRHKRPSASRSPAAPSARRSSSRSSCSVASARWSVCVLPADTSEITAPTAVVPSAPEQPRPRRRWVRGIAIALAAIFGFFALYIGITFVQVWLASRHDGAKAADAIVVLGAAQYDGRPSPVLTARLDHALDLWKQGLAPIIVVTGGKRPGDRFTEATASRELLAAARGPRRQDPPRGARDELVGVARGSSAHPARTRPLRGDLGERPLSRAPHRWDRA